MSRPLARVLGLLLLVVALWLPAVTEGHAAPTYPALTARIVDEAGLLGSADEAELTRLLEALETASTDQLVVATVSSLQGYPIEEFAHGLAQHWQLGQKGKDNGVLLLVAPNERAVRIEVGRRLEPMLPDGLAGSIIRSRILPSFRRGDFAAGIKGGVTDIRDVLLGDVEAVKQRAAGGRTEGEIDPAAMLFLIVWLLFLALFIWQFVRAVRNTPAGAARGRIRRGPDIVVIPGPGGWGGSGGWSGGGGSRGGGWSGGGGGSFGGGGASGRW